MEDVYSTRRAILGLQANLVTENIKFDMILSISIS